ncbi:hypothetical protein, partial [Limosilactobacillus sp.]|uniref:hypothetical protein n=1 Tax=Limosilactobacillus sp. TaxID=2773925 RepID=UPI00359FF88D
RRSRRSNSASGPLGSPVPRCSLANETGYQLKNVNLNRDFTVDDFGDIRVANDFYYIMKK